MPSFAPTATKWLPEAVAKVTDRCFEATGNTCFICDFSPPRSGDPSAVQQANSGHPGMPMGMADIAEVLFNDYMKINPGNPDWVDRDRFILSAGHGSMFLYAWLHISGFDIPMAQIRNFRQLHSRTPGHPEYGDTPGVEATTGPLGQGVGNAVGAAVAAKMAAVRFNTAKHRIFDHHVFCLVGLEG